MSEFTQLLEREIPRLRRYARALTRDVERADDLVQTCLVRGLAKQHLWQAGTDLRAWLFTIMHNLRISDIRQSVREQKGAAAIKAFQMRKSDPDERLDLLDLDRAIADLPERQRQLILLIGLEGMRYDQAAAMFAVPIGTIRSRIGRAREALRKLIHVGAGTADPQATDAARIMPRVRRGHRPQYLRRSDASQRRPRRALHGATGATTPGVVG